MFLYQVSILCLRRYFFVKNMTQAEINIVRQPNKLYISSILLRFPQTWENMVKYQAKIEEKLRIMRLNSI